MQDWIVAVMERLGYAGMALLIAVENIFPPIPSEVILPFGGFLTTCTDLTAWGMVLAATGGSVAGALALYGVGRLLGVERMEKLLAGPVGKTLGFSPEQAARAAARFDEKGSGSVFFCRCVPVLRSLISIPAGMAKMPMGRFLLYTAAGSFVWNTVLIHLGAAAGQGWALVAERFSAASHLVGWLLAAAAATALAVWLWRRVKK